MKKSILFLAIAATTLSATAQTKTPPVKKAAVKQEASHWDVDPVHSTVKFTIKHLAVSEVEGSFKVYTGTIDATNTDFTGATVNFTIDVNSLNTDNEMRDKHVKSDDFFNAEKFPKMTFVSTSFKKVKGPLYTLEGNLTIRDVTKKVTFNVYYGGTMVDPYGNTKAGFKATGKINRQDFHLKWNSKTSTGEAVLGDDVNMTLNLEFAKKK